YKSISSVQAVAVALVGGIGEQADRQAAVRWSNDLPAADEKRGNVAAVHIFEFAVASQERNYHGGVFFTDALAGKKPVGGGYDFCQRGTRDQLRDDHALQSRGQQGSRNSLPRDIGEYDGKPVFGVYRIVKIAPDLLTREIAAIEAGKRHMGNCHGHQA